MKYPYIIAEAGSCHEGQLARALSLVYYAKHADADAVKFQYWSSASHMRARRRMEDVPSAYEAGSLKQEWLQPLSHTAHQIGLEFMCTAYLPEDVKVVAPYVDMFKVSSFECADKELAEAHRPYHAEEKTIIVSLGMGGETDDDLWGDWAKYLHCVSGYPVPLDQAAVCLSMDGYSDHTRNVLTGAVAVGADAHILEVHFRLDDTSRDCPDYVVALTPTELHQYVWNARQAGRMMTSKTVQDCERINLRHRVGV